MHYFEFATKDTTIYEASQSLNSGLDEILEVRKDINPDGTITNVSRALLKFDLSYISESIVNGLITSPRFFLNLYDANSEALATDDMLWAYPVSQSWEMGSGRSDSYPRIGNGANWKYRDGSPTETAWFGSYSTLQGSTFASGTLSISDGNYINQELTIGSVDFMFVNDGTNFDNSASELYIVSASTTGSSLQNLAGAINDSSSLHGLSISASVDLSVEGGGQIILSGSARGTTSNYAAASSSGLFVFGSGDNALEGGTDETISLSGGGGTWYSGSGYEASQSFNHEAADLRMDVTNIVNSWLGGSTKITNEGFILKRSGSMGNTDSSLAEGNTDHLGNFKFFSRETHTVFPPKLEVVWDDSSWTTGSLSALSSDNLNDMVLYMRGLRPEYREKSKVKFRVTGRERYPEKSYSTSGYSTGYTTVKYLPSGSSYYQIRDAYTEDIIVPFGDGTKLSCDSTGNYFNLWMDGLQAERFYRVEYKIVSGSGTSDETVEFYDEKHSFKVVR